MRFLKAVFPGKYVQGEGVLDRLPYWVDLLGRLAVACAPGEAIHHEAAEITPQKVLNAMFATDALGRARKTSSMEARS